MKDRFDCSKCPGYCCSHPRIEVTETDIKRLAKHFGLSAAQAKKKFTYHFKTLTAMSAVAPCTRRARPSAGSTPTATNAATSIS